MTQNKKRIIQFDVLRVIAAFAVVLLHTASHRYDLSFPTAEWDARNLYDSFSRWGVPIFVMISGALFLDSKKQINIKTLYAKNIAHIFFIFILWSFIYAVDCRLRNECSNIAVSQVIQGPIHFWFLKMLLVLYFMIPILRAVVTDIKIERYFLCLSFVFSFCIPMLFPLMKDTHRQFFEYNYHAYKLDIVPGFAGYFVLGHYLMNSVVRKTTKRIIYVLGLLSPVAVFFLTRYISIHDGTTNTLYYDNINLFTLSEAVAIFLFVKDREISPKYQPFILSASKLSLGIYIIHPLMLTHSYGIWDSNTSSLPILAFIPIDAILIFMVSLLVTLVLSKIPYIKKIVT